MTDETSSEPNQYELLKTEMQSQFNALKESFEAQSKEQTALIAALKQQNEQLQRALVRSAFTPVEPKEQPKSEEDLYQEEVQRILNKAKSYAKMR